MTVSELIDRLGEFDPDLDVRVPSEECSLINASNVRLGQAGLNFEETVVVIY